MSRRTFEDAMDQLADTDTEDLPVTTDPFDEFKVRHGCCGICQPDLLPGDRFVSFCGVPETATRGAVGVAGQPPDDACIVCVFLQVAHWQEEGHAL
jgi:hypothetical protein